MILLVEPERIGMDSRPSSTGHLLSAWGWDSTRKQKTAGWRLVVAARRDSCDDVVQAWRAVGYRDEVIILGCHCRLPSRGHNT